MLSEVSRLVVSVMLLALCAFLYWFSFHTPEVAEKLGATNAASLIIGANVTYWLKPIQAK